MQRLLTLLLALGLCSWMAAQPRLKSGDLLFTVVADTTTDNLGTAIVKATNRDHAPHIDHVGIVCTHKGRLHVLEATTRGGVRLCPLDAFLIQADHTADGKPLVLVGRIKDDFDRRTSLRNAKAYLGRQYDAVYSPTDDEIYCSELVQKSYVDHKGNLIFSPEPMSFHGADGHILPYWTAFYQSRGLPVPEGEPGSNPTALSQHPAVSLIGRYY
jgi:hypothetical protein